MKKTATTIALAAILAGASHAAINGKKPAFMDKQQLAAMRAEAASKSIKDTENPAFFTGKPYLASTDGYAFKYRSYSPRIARWTSEDPSGFPDGANGSFYAPVPTRQFDYCGLNASDFQLVAAVISGWDSLGFKFSKRLADHSVSQLDDRDAMADEIKALQNSSKFSSVFDKAYFTGKHAAGTMTGTEIVNYRGISDLGYSYGRVSFDYSMTLSGTSSFAVTFSFADIYDFAPASPNPAIAAFNRLQQAGVATIFTSSGSFDKFYE